MAILGAAAGGVADPLSLAEGTTDPQYLLRACDVVRLLNSTPLGAVINERQLFRHRNRAGDRIGSKRRIELLRYIGWLVEQRCARTRRHAAKAQRRRQERLTLNGIMAIIEDQQYRCALSGRLLTPEDAALDHILALTRGGRHELTNAQVLHKDINRAKGTLTNEEFIALCRDVVIHAIRQGLCPALDEGITAPP
jgi:5-methylcytosine-specific restriction endonuclease McrA